MEEQNVIDKKIIRNKMAQVLSEDIKPLSKGMQAILVDDLATAFEARMLVLRNAQTEKKSKKLQTYVDFALEIANETPKQ